MSVLQSMLDMQEQIHQINTEKGFWENKLNRNKGEMVMLMITELSEAVEGDRAKLRWKGINPDTYLSENWEAVFVNNVKNTVEDEIADTVIRILDYCHGFDIKIIERDYRKPTTGNFANDVLRIVHYTITAFHEDFAKDWGYVLAAIITFCEWYQIDIIQHMKWKIKYNSNRPYKHGKQY